MRVMRVAVAVGVLVAASPAAQRQPLFEFHSSFWMNLHTYLYALARANAPIVEPLPDSATAAEREQWSAAVRTYRERFGKRSLIFDADLSHLTYEISKAESRPDLAGAAIDGDTRSLLESVAPIYRRRWWTTHDAANKRFIAGLEPLLATHGEAIAARLAKTFDRTWPAPPPRADIVHEAGPPGNAHTVSNPLHVTVAAADPRYAALDRLELVFHETSHHWDAILMQDVDAAAKRLGVRPNRNLWHAILFFNAGTITTDVLRAAGIRDYVQIMDADSVFTDLRPIVAKHWPAFLAGEISRDEAIARMVAEMAKRFGPDAFHREDAIPSIAR